MARQTLKDLGESLKAKRKERNLSLKEAENATSIRMTYLQAIEEGEVGKMISQVYAQGFIRQYATYLGMDVETIFRQQPDFLSGVQSQEFSYGIGTLEMRGNPGSSVKGMSNVIWILGLGVLLIAAYFFASFLEVI